MSTIEVIIQPPVEIDINKGEIVVAQVNIQAPIELQAVQNGLAVGPKGDKGDPGLTIMLGDKSSALNEGTQGDASLGDDYVYFCTKTGTVGNAIWKKSPLFIST